MNGNDYIQAIRLLALDKDSMLFSNSGPEHGAAVISNMFDTAKDNVKIYANCMNGEISSNSDYITSLKKLLKRKVPIQVLVDSEPSEFCGKGERAFEILHGLSKEPSESVGIKFASESIRQKLRSELNTNEVIHFQTADSRMFRLETDPDKHTAICSFNNKQLTKRLNSIFNAAYQTGKPVP